MEDEMQLHKMSEIRGAFKTKVALIIIQFTASRKREHRGMRELKYRSLFVGLALLSALSACASARDDSARLRLAAVLRDSLGKTAEATPSFLNDSTHLQIDISSNHFSALDAAARGVEARTIAALSLRNYVRRSDVDSVRIQGRELVSRGFWAIHWAYDFAAKDLGVK